MSVFKPADSKFYRYNFDFKGRRYSKSTGETTKKAAIDAQSAMQRTLRRRAAGLESEAAADTPTFSEWAEVTLKWQTTVKKIKRPDTAENTYRMILAFWGARPTKDEPVDGGPYYDLRLGHPIGDADYIVEFEEWMKERGLSGARINHYRSACSMLYRVALLPKYRKITGIRFNPFRDLGRERTRRRTKTFTPDQLTKLVETAPLPVVIGVALGALTPALRLANVVEMKRAEHLAPDLSFLTVPHKTDRDTGEPLVQAVPPILQALLKTVFEQFPDDPYVVPVKVGPSRREFRKRKAAVPRGGRYWNFTKLVKDAIIDAGLPYGRDDGLTFHSLRHTMNTNMARWGLSREARNAAGGHTTMAMTDWYTHISGSQTHEAAIVIDAKMRGFAELVTARVRAHQQTPDLKNDGQE